MTEPEPGAAIEACRAAHKRLTATASGIDDETARRPSRLPDWTVGHVLTHVARNADGHAHRLEGALRGEDVPRYPLGMDERNRAIEEGAGRPARELAADVAESAARLEDTWELVKALERLPQRLTRPEDAGKLLAWLINRADAPTDLELGPWM